MSFKDRIQKVLDYYDIFKKENLAEKVKPILKTLLIEDDKQEIKEIEEAINDIFSAKTGRQSILSLKLGFDIPTYQEASGEYKLGQVLKGEVATNEFGLNDAELCRNILIAGKIGAGKTTTCMKILYEFAKKKKPVLIFDFKNDYISLLKVMEELHGPSIEEYLWVFLVGVDDFKFNPLRIPNKNGKFLIDPLAFIESFVDVFIHCYGLREPSASILVTCLKKLYEEYGIFDNNFMEFPTLNELKEEVARYEVLSNFDRESQRSIYVRLRLLTEGVLGKVFNTNIGVKFEDIIKRFVILGLADVPLIENRKFIIELFMGMIYHYAKSIDDRRKTKQLVVIEEAHNVLPKQKSSFMIDVLSKPEICLMELRDLGIGHIIIDQKPADLSPEAIAVTGTKIIHALDREEDKEAIAKAIGLNEEQKKYLSYLKKGEVYVKLDRENFPYPFHAKIEPITFTGQVSKREIIEYMRDFFDSYRTEKSQEETYVKTINPEEILENERWLKSVESKISSISEKSRQVIVLLAEGLACKSNDFKEKLRITGSEFKQAAHELVSKGLVGFKKPKAAGNPTLYFLRPEGLAAFKLLTGKWPFEMRAKKMSIKNRHSEIKRRLSDLLRNLGWRELRSRNARYVDLCFIKDGSVLPIEICTGTNNLAQIYSNILKCVDRFGGVYFVCENRIAYNLALQQAAKVSFDQAKNFAFYIAEYSKLIQGKDFEKYEFI